MKVRFNIGKVYFLYLFFAMFLQILGVDSKGSSIDTIWKGAVIAITMIYVVSRCGLTIHLKLLKGIYFYVLGQFVAIIAYPRSLDAAPLVSVLVNMFVIIAMLYLFFAAPYTNKTFMLDDITTFLNLFLALMGFAVIYNIIVYPTAVFGFMFVRNAYSNMMSSFFDTKQVFGFFLALACFASILQFIITDKKIYIPIGIVFAFNLIICLSRTAIVAACVFFLVFVFSIFRKDRKLALFILSGIVVTCIIASFVPQIRGYIKNVLLYGTDATMSGRNRIWKGALNSLHSIQWIVGYGEASSVIVLQKYANANFAHNGIIQLLITGGILKLVLYSIAVFASIRNMRRIKNEFSLISSALFASLCGVLTYSLGESIYLFDSSISCVAGTIFCVGIPCCLSAYIKQDTT